RFQSILRSPRGLPVGLPCLDGLIVIGGLYMLEMRLQNVCAACCETCGTIGQIIAPHAAEALVEAHRRDLVGHLVEAMQPRFERMRIVQAETIEFRDLQARFATLFRDALR